MKKGTTTTSLTLMFIAYHAKKTKPKRNKETLIIMNKETVEQYFSKFPKFAKKN